MVTQLLRMTVPFLVLLKVLDSLSECLTTRPRGRAAGALCRLLLIAASGGVAPVARFGEATRVC